jgi:hypothetical protein
VNDAMSDQVDTNPRPGLLAQRVYTAHVAQHLFADIVQVVVLMMSLDWLAA